MRILIDYRPALRQRTGVGLWVARLVEALAADAAARDTQVAVFSSSWKDRLPASLPDGVDRIDRRVPGRLLNWLWHRREWPPVETLAGRTFDVVHSSSPLLVPARRAAALVTIHDLDFLDHPGRAVREIRRDYPRLAGEHARRADGVIVSSSYTASAVSERLRVAPERVTVCPVGAPDWPARPRPPASGHLLFVGTLGARKNVDRLLTAYAAMCAVRPTSPPLVLAGGADAGTDAALLERLACVPLLGRARHVGYVDDERLRALYRDAILLVLPSLDEGFGIPALEAMTLGVPVVAANRGALPEVVADAGLLVDPLDTGALSAAMARVLDDGALRERLAAAGPVRARQFSWRASAATLTTAYEAAVERRREGADANRH